ncbi:hypothetical protein H072_4612 [Dactylellina haptotyla CBS 200.50]|uniref:Ankyrin repeat protein n=1 Tax=Dactylellina haptotyla (strain CBS 200.50) TaxID=1284197 RepID=S8AF02_DACHA|nr:hypothetical protein H072_4612 [Dactylellina haptotyla CBS 200.50]
MSGSESLPSVPVAPASFLSYIAENEGKPVRDLIQPYLEYESKLRALFAQDPSNAALADNTVGLVPIYGDSGLESAIKVQARNLEAETPETKSKYLMELDEKVRKKNGDRAIVDFDEFKKNFAIFSEGALQNLDWTNIIAAGSSVLTPILPVPQEQKATKRSLRDWYHEKIAPSSDVDLFIYGTKDEDVAIKRMESIEATIRDNLLWETTSIRTKNTITIVSQYPNRHIQIVLRLYSSISEILTGFDVSCACVAYDGSQVYANPRAIASWMLQCNDVDLTRRSPSYEFRLSKYRRRGFEVYYPGLTREKIDPTIYERSINRLKGLAKLLVLERLPDAEERETYLEDRRSERGRPAKTFHRSKKTLNGDLKAEAEIPEWEISEEEQSSYHTISIPYGKPHNAKRSEKLLYQKDMLLNAEWNKRAQKERAAYLHRHPVFIGSVKDIIEDCCGYCPEAKNDEEKELQAEDDKTYVRGKMSFLKDDPGRQEIGSFNPVTEEDWTEMAYIGDDETLCKAIVAKDVDAVRKWAAEEGHDVNRRDHTGRTPLHLAALTSTPEIVKILLDAGAKMVWRIVDGRTALHIAAARGESEIVKLLLLKSQENEEIRDEREDRERAAKGLPAKKEGEDEEMEDKQENNDEDEDMAEEDEDEDIEMVSEDGSVTARTARSGASSFVEVNKKKSEEPEAGALGAEEEQDDVLDLNLTDWDYQMSPLHFAIVNGHKEVVELLVSEFGADVLQPVKVGFDYQGIPRSALLTIHLIVNLPKKEQRERMLRTLLELGASSAQADMSGVSAFMRIVQMGDLDCLKILFEEDAASAMAAAKHIISSDSWRATPNNSLIVAIRLGDQDKALMLLDKGISPEITFDEFVKATKKPNNSANRASMYQNFLDYHEQPAELALEAEMPEVFVKCIELGVDPSSYSSGSAPLDDDAGNRNRYNQKYMTLIDLVKKKVKYFNTGLETFREEQRKRKESQTPRDMVSLPAEYKEGTYEHWMASLIVENENKTRKTFNENLEKNIKNGDIQTYDLEKVNEKEEKLKALAKRYKEIAEWLVSKGAKSYKELQPAMWKKSNNKNDDDDSDYESSTDSRKVPVPADEFEIKFTFSQANKSEALTAAYQELFKATWDGDEETIKKYTTTSWEKDKTPLHITAANQLGHNMFSIAVYRKHPKELLNTILSIATAQQSPEDDTEKQYNAYYEESDEYDSDYESDDENAELYVEQVDLTEGKLTIDNIANLGKEVRSGIKTTAFIRTPVPIVLEAPGYDKTKAGDSSILFQAVVAGDFDLVKYIVSTLEKLEAGPNSGSLAYDTSAFCTPFVDHEGEAAVHYERIDILEYLLQHHGIGALLAEKKDIKDNEEEEEEMPDKPKYYLGLSIHGKKRKDWAKAANPNETNNNTNSDRQPMALFAAHFGSHKVFEWLQTDAPEAALREYQKKLEAQKNAEENRYLKNLQKADKVTIKRWMGYEHPLLLHAVVTNIAVRDDKEKTDQEKVTWYESNMKYFLNKNPSLLESKENCYGVTPLLFAGSVVNKYAIQALINLGADQHAKQQDTGRNLIHMILNGIQSFDDYYSYSSAKRTLEEITACLDILPEDLKAWGFTQRGLGDDVAYTPLAYYMIRPSGYYGGSSSASPEIVEKLLEHSKGIDLGLRTSLGDLPIHTAAKETNVGILQHIVKVATPDIILTENANGMTALELADAKRYQHIVKEIPSVDYNSWGSWTYNGSVTRMSCDKKKEEKKDFEFEEKDAESVKVWKVLDQAVGKATVGGRSTRVLVSLKEANETAERLAKRQAKEKVQRRRRYHYYSSQTSQKNKDIVGKWYT